MTWAQANLLTISDASLTLTIHVHSHEYMISILLDNKIEIRAGRSEHPSVLMPYEYEVTLKIKTNGFVSVTVQAGANGIACHPA